MQPYYYFFLITLLSFVFLFAGTFLLRKRNIPGELFAEALKNENNGNFEAAMITYEIALNEVKKNRFHSNRMKNKITEKLKVLNTIIEYENSLHVTS